ncbi:DnaJ-like subfamily B member 13 [Vitis vinifera]|uniref:DnaJ-like subfamily B member 13 n=1 Tax=Vitis vinifera TaxID=29760 RepID=A0A438E6R1_VITVI|nr:DnaJ-like subfamily B member 13 [Vitis vinifera]
MGDPPRSPTPDFYSILGISRGASILDVCKAYKSLAKKWHPDKNPSNKPEAQAKFQAINEAYKVIHLWLISAHLLGPNKGEEKTTMGADDSTTPKGSYFHLSMDDGFFQLPSFLSKSSRGAPPPPPYPKVLPAEHQPNSLSKSASRRSNSAGTSTDFAASLSKSTSRRSTTPIIYSQSTVRRKPQPIEKKLECTLEELCHGCNKKIKITRDVISDIGFVAFFPKSSPSFLSGQHSALRRLAIASFGNICSGRICNLCFSYILNWALNFIDEWHPFLNESFPAKTQRKEFVQLWFMPLNLQDFLLIVQEEEILRIQIKPGWRQGTKVKFDGRGDERPGTLPADIIFLIDEKRHPIFKRVGDNLEIGVEIPLVKAITGCPLSVPLLGGEKMSLFIDDIIYHGYEKIIPGQGMPMAKQEGRRGDLKIKFLVSFPTELSDQQRSDVYRILQDSS